MEFKTAVIYARYSSDNQREESIDAQLRAINDYCSKGNIKVIKTYTDEAQSAKTDDRIQFSQMFSDILREYVSPNFVIVHKLDRFSRNRCDSAIYKKKLKDKGVSLVSVLERLDDSPESVILESVLEGINEYYSLNLAREVMKGMKETALQCKHTGGTPALGYKVNSDKTYDIVEQEAEAVKIIYEMYSNGSSYNEIITVLNSKGYKTKSGNHFAKNSLRDIIVNEKYKGTYTFNKRVSGKRHNRKYKDDSEIIRIQGGIPSIVTEQLWEDANKRLSERAQGPRVKSTQYYLLTGKIFCGECGCNYTGNSTRGGSGNKYNIYSCTARHRQNGCKNKSMRKDIIEKYVIDTIRELILNTEAIDRITEELCKRFEESRKFKNTELGKLKAEKKDLQVKVDKLLDMYLDGDIGKEAYHKKADTINLRFEDVSERLEYLENRDFSSFDKTKVKNDLNAYMGKLEDQDIRVQRKVVETFVEKITIHNDKIEITMDFNPRKSLVKGGGGEPCLFLSEPISRREFDALYQ